MKQTPKIIVALDYDNEQDAIATMNMLDNTKCMVKIGKELFVLAGTNIVKIAREKGFEVFLDLKFHDIPNTVAKAIISCAKLDVYMITVHCLGGLSMLQAAKNACKTIKGRKPKIIGVSILTSMTNTDLQQIGINNNVDEEVFLLANLANEACIDGLVCSANEAATIKEKFPNLELITPGIRPSFASSDDQKRIMTPKQAKDNGSDYLVIGRPITKHQNPKLALELILQELE